VAVQVPADELYRMSVDEYHRLIESGGLAEDARIELLGGLVVAMSPKTRAHEDVVTWLTEWLYAHADLSRHQVRVQSPLPLPGSEPEPDLALIDREAPRPYHPASAVLVIEVVVSSQRRDLHDKPPLYAAAAVPDLWVIDLDAGQAWVHRDPGPQGYATVRRLGGDDDALEAAALARTPALHVGDVLGAAR